MQQRGLLHAIIAPHGREISLYDTHLQNKSQPMRIAQIRALDPVVAADQLPLVLGGDFNSTPNSPVIGMARQVLSDTWTDVGVGAGLTHPSWHLQGRIDYLFHRGDIQPVQADVVNGGFSDHMAVRATYEYRYRHGRVCHLSIH
jgi:endonuclease/exonuclease/phosphatase (EEP) superfamily protein YafD